MPLTDKYPLAVTFIIGRVKQGDGSTRLGPIGTGFVVNLTMKRGLSFEYVVTASHVVDGKDETFARIRTRDGGTKDLLVHEWVHHPRADVAAAPFNPVGHTNLHLLNVPAASTVWTDVPDWGPNLGDRIYFLGLLGVPGARGMAERNLPMVRSGIVGAMYQDDVPVEWPDKSIRRFQAHLIDCRSYGGFSGSPCFFQRDDAFVGVKEGVEQRGRATFLLGLISGHFDQFSNAQIRGDIAEEGSIRVPINTSVGIVTPAEKIKEVLLMEEFSEERERVQREHDEHDLDEAATLDSVEAESEYDRFEDLARKLVNTPKPDKNPAEGAS